MSEAARQIARMAATHCAAWTRNDPLATCALFAEDGEISVNGGAPHVGHAAIAEAAHALMETFPGVIVTCQETREAGDRAVMVWTLEGRHSETGNYVVLPGWHEWELNADRKVQRCRGFYDLADLERQIAGS